MAAGQIHAVGRGYADQRRAPQMHLPYCGTHLPETVYLLDNQPMGELALIDDAHRLVFFREPDRLQLRFLRHASTCFSNKMMGVIGSRPIGTPKYS